MDLPDADQHRSPQRLHEAMSRADAALARFAPGAALALYDDVLRHDPALTRAAAGRVRALWMRREVDRARFELDLLGRRAPHDPDFHLARGLVALGVCDDPALLDPTSASCRQDLRAAEDAFRTALVSRPDSPVAVRGLVTVCRLQRRTAEAYDLLAAFPGADTTSTLLVEKAQILLDQHDIPGGLELLHRAIAADRRDVEPYLQLVTMLSWHGHVTEAWSTFHEIEQRFGHTSPEIDELEGWMRLKELDDLADPRARADCLRSAEAAFARTLDAEPRHVGARSGRASVRRYRMGLEDGRATLASELATDPDSPQLNTDLGWLLCFDEPVRSIKHFQTALDEAPYLLSARAGLATALLMAGRPEEAEHDLAELTERYPRHLETLQTASFAATMAADHDTALLLADQAVAGFPRDPEAYYRRADVLLAMKRYDGASEDGDELSTAVQRWPGHVGLRWQKAMRAEADGWIAEARQEFRVIAQLDPRDVDAVRNERRLTRRLQRRPFYSSRWRTIDAGARREMATDDFVDTGAAAAGLGPEETANARRRVRAVRVHEAQQKALHDESDEWVGLVAMALPVLVVVPVLLGWFGAAEQSAGWRAGVVALMIVLYATTLALLVYSIVASVVVALLLVAVSVWSFSGGDPARDFLWVAVGWTTLFLVVEAGLLWLYFVGAELRARRYHNPSAQGLLIRDLLALLDLLDGSPLTDWENRGRIAEILNAIAVSQAALLQHVGTTLQLTADLRGRNHVSRRALGTAAATRDYRNAVLTQWNPFTEGELRRWGRRMLLAAAREEWGEFAWNSPDPPSVHARSVLRRAAVGLAVLTVVGLGVALLLLGQEGTGSAMPSVATMAAVLIATAPAVAAVAELAKMLAARRPTDQGSSSGRLGQRQGTAAARS